MMGKKLPASRRKPAFDRTTFDRNGWTDDTRNEEDAWVNLYSTLPVPSSLFYRCSYRSNRARRWFFSWHESTSVSLVRKYSDDINTEHPQVNQKFIRIHNPPPRNTLAYNHYSSRSGFSTVTGSFPIASQWYARCLYLFSWTPTARL